MNRTHPVAALLAALALLGLSACCSARPAPEAPPPSPAASEGAAPASPSPVATGEVGPTPRPAIGTIPLGGACARSGDCDGDGFCLFPEAAACGDGGVAGVCTERPRICQKDCRGACGCDGERYCNRCSAEGRGVSIRHQGRCDLPKLVRCGGIAGLRCPEGLSCDYGPPETMHPDKMGVCRQDAE